MVAKIPVPAACSIGFLKGCFKRSGDLSTLSLSLFASTMLSIFLYLEAFEIEAKLLNSVVVLPALYIFLTATRKQSFVIGTLLAFFWFWWVGLSFRFTDYFFLAFIVPVLVSVIYGAIFYLASFLPVWGRALFFAYGFVIIEPFGFAWLKLDLITTNTFFSANSLAFVLIMASLAGFYYVRSIYRWLLFLLLLPAIWLPTPDMPSMPDLSIKLVESKVPQAIKWEREYLNIQIADTLDQIDQAITDGYEMIVLPEAVIPHFLNKNRELLELIRYKSYEITIIMGSLYLEGRLPYNSAYIFVDGNLTVANKMFLVPFGEGNPLPKWLGAHINRIFFDNAEDYKTAEKPTDYQVNGVMFRNAICYEAGIETLYKNAPDYIIAISNNGWFVPSIEPAMQRLFMKLYGKRHGVVVLHSSNESKSEVVGIDTK